MEAVTFLNSYAYKYWQAAVEFLVVLFLVGGLAALAAGLGLIFNSAGTLKFFAGMNRWVSTRRVLKPVEIPRDTRGAVQKYRHVLAALFVAGGAFALYVLATRFDVKAVIFGLRLEFLRPAFAGWLIESTRWVLIAGNLAAIVVGMMLAFIPDTLTAIEARGSHWYSERKLARNRDAMHLTLDNWVTEFPRASGCVITFFALALVGAFGLMLPAIR